MTNPEARKESGIRWVRALIICLIWTVTGGVIIPLLSYTLPDIEASVYPPLKDQEVSEARINPANDHFMLWLWSFHKNRRSFPEFVSFMAFDPERPNERVPVEVFTDWECSRNFRTDRTSMSGTDTDKHMCARLPVYWRGRSDIIIEGYAEYRVGHPFYTIPVRIPRVNATKP